MLANTHTDKPDLAQTFPGSLVLHFFPMHMLKFSAKAGLVLIGCFCPLAAHLEGQLTGRNDQSRAIAFNLKRSV